MDALLGFLFFISILLFIASWIIPNVFVKLLKNKVTKGQVRLILGISPIIFLTLGVMTSKPISPDDNYNRSPEITEKQVVAQSQDNKSVEQVTIQPKEVTKKDFSLYEDFFNLRNEQFKKLDQLLSGLSTQRRITMLKADDNSDTLEYIKMNDIAGAFFDFEKKLDKNNPMQKKIADAIDDYANLGGAIFTYQTWIGTYDEDTKNSADSQRRKGDTELNGLLASIKQEGYSGTGIIDSGLDISISPETKVAIYKASCKNISYKVLEKDPDSNIGENVYFSGKIEQAGTDYGSDWFRISVTPLGYGTYIDTMWVTTSESTDFVEGDVVKFWGTLDSAKCYKSQANFNICIPSVDAKYISK